MAEIKPLGHRSYGHIPHLPGSRMGAGDHHCHQGQFAICCEQPRDRHDRVIVTEKLDGSNVSIAKLNGEILAIGRAGYLARTSRFEQHHMFADWVAANEDRFQCALEDGQRFVGEWLAQAHGTRYELPHEPFVAFDLMAGNSRLPFDEFRDACRLAETVTAAVLHDGAPISIDDVTGLISVSAHGAIDPVEGAVWRVERRGVFDFIAKFVRPEKRDGALLPEISGNDAVWNWKLSA